MFSKHFINSKSNEMIEVLKSLFIRDLKRLRKEVTLYKNEGNLWKLENDISNTAGNLACHLVGNLKWFVGAQLGNTGYVRKRDLEFSEKNIPRDEILKRINETSEAVESTLNGLSHEDLDKDYPLEVFGSKMTVGYFLVHLSGHLMYHTGQINYHRRLLDE